MSRTEGFGNIQRIERAANPIFRVDVKNERMAIVLSARTMCLVYMTVCVWDVRTDNKVSEEENIFIFIISLQHEMYLFRNTHIHIAWTC